MKSMRSYFSKAFIILSIAILMLSCSEESEKSPAQIEREQVAEIEQYLQSNLWNFNNVEVEIKHESRAMPFMINLADDEGMIQPGVYDAYDIYGEDDVPSNYSYQFNSDKELLVDVDDEQDFNIIGKYSVLSTTEMRINLDTTNRILFAYEYGGVDNKLKMAATGIRNENLVDGINDRIFDAVLAGKPTVIADKLVTFLQENETINAKINELLYDLVYGKIDEITESPEEAAEMIAELVVNKLQDIDWEEILYDKILDFLQQLQVDDAEATARELAQKISDKIEASISYSDIYETILPIMQQVEEEKLPVLAERIADSVYGLIAAALSEENIYNKVYPVWDEFTQADSSSVTEVADTLSSIVTNHFFDKDELTQKLIPFIATVDETSTVHLSRLAQEIIDDVLIPVVDTINATFPGLELSPDWDEIKPYITSVLTAIKAALNTSTIEELSATMANAIIKVMDIATQKAFEAVIFKFQSIPADQVASIVASWVTNLVEMAEQPIIDFVETKLNDIFDAFDAQKVSEELAALIHDTIIELFSEDNLYKVLLPLLEALQDADMEAAAGLISSWIVDLGIISDNIDAEELVMKINEILIQLIGSMEPEIAIEKLVELIQESGVTENIDGSLLTKLLEIKIYDFMYIIARDINAVENIEITLLRK